MAKTENTMVRLLIRDDGQCFTYSPKLVERSDMRPGWLTIYPDGTRKVEADKVARTTSPENANAQIQQLMSELKKAQEEIAQLKMNAGAASRVVAKGVTVVPENLMPVPVVGEDVPDLTNPVTEDDGPIEFAKEDDPAEPPAPAPEVPKTPKRKG